jgi:hypothetical protein
MIANDERRHFTAGTVGECCSAQADRSKICSACHREIWESYRKTGMGRSFSRPSPDNTPIPAGSYYHAPSESYFTMSARGGEFFQRRRQVDSFGSEVNVMEKRVDYVLGSGNHARTYLHRTPADTFIELPLGWYAEKGGYWAMNPGYDRPDHEGFRRPITYDCMFCHNAYPKVPARNEKPREEAVYGALPEGIDCERCHGAGARHIELAGRPGGTRDPRAPGPGRRSAPRAAGSAARACRRTPRRRADFADCESCTQWRRPAPRRGALVWS